MKISAFLLLILAFCSYLYAESELSSDINSYPFKFKPTTNIELIVTKVNDSIFVTYPNGNRQKIKTLENSIWSSPGITKDFNFDGYTDLAIVVAVNPRGLNESYAIFLWDNEKKRLKEARNIVNPSIEKKQYLVENAYFTGSMCEQVNKPICNNKILYKWKGGQLDIFASLAPLKENRTKISFYKNGKVVKIIVVPDEDISATIK